MTWPSKLGHVSELPAPWYSGDLANRHLECVVRLRRFDQAADYLAAAGTYLVAREAEHNLMIGLSHALAQHPERFDTSPYLAAIDHDGVIVAAALMTPPANLVLSHTEEPAAIHLVAADVKRGYSALPGVFGPSDVSRSFAECWRGLTRQPYALHMAQRIYRLESVTPSPGAPGSLRRAGPSDRELVIEWMTAFHVEAGSAVDPARAALRAAETRLDSPDSALYFWIDGSPVSLTGYTGPTPNGIRVGPVYTPPEHRGRGYASACVAALSQRLLDSGRKFCCLFTDLSNQTSNHIYQAIGYRPVCDADEYRFAQPAN